MAKDNGRPYTDVEDLVNASVDQAVDERILPAVDKLNNATKKLDDITPILKGIVDRQAGQAIWMYSITICIVVIAIVVVVNL
ncbi:hypothetical protein LCGC14_1394530 [marine sediment metagenome]|uniref:Uncharacterized protein n=1 Tax=marine sediment metagenome TaxID=412755 RepID=A0A0F9KJS4_9ZZZZ